MRKFRILAILAIAGLSFVAGAWFYKFFIYEDSCYDAGGALSKRGWCIGVSDE